MLLVFLLLLKETRPAWLETCDKCVNLFAVYSSCLAIGFLSLKYNLIHPLDPLYGPSLVMYMYASAVINFTFVTDR